MISSHLQSVVWNSKYLLSSGAGGAVVNGITYPILQSYIFLDPSPPGRIYRMPIAYARHNSADIFLTLMHIKWELKPIPL